jgi:hypothetical protein
MLIGTAVGGGISAFGAYQGGQAQKAYYNYQANVQRQLAGIATQKAGRDIMAGEQEAQKYGIQTAQVLGGTTARAGAGNVLTTGGSTVAVLQSQRAAGLEEQATARQTAGERAYGEYVEAAAKRAGGGALDVAGQQAETAGIIGGIGKGVATVGQVAGMGFDIAKTTPTLAGDAQPVSSKWYEGLDTMSGGSGQTTGPPLNLIG